MTMSKAPDADAVRRANIEYHARLMGSYADLPHFGAQSVARVRSILAGLATGGTLVDLGCGTGFVLGAAKGLFARSVGVDICRAALDLVPAGLEAELLECPTEALDLPDGCADVASGFSMLHHLHDIEPTLREALRILRPGGAAYFDDEPNKAYFSMIADLAGRQDLPPALAEEVHSVVDVERIVAERDGIPEELVRLAEYQKLMRGGFDPDEVHALLERIGFTDVSVHYRWFLGQRDLARAGNEEAQALVGAHLAAQLPATRSLFKYFWFTARKPHRSIS